MSQRCESAQCRRLEELYGERRHLTIRAATPEERKYAGEFWATGAPMKAPRWVVVDAEDPSLFLGGFGLVNGGNSKAEAVFWAERWASKNGGHFIRPEGWEKVVAHLPDRKP